MITHDVGRKNWIKIVPIGDTHVGSEECDEKKLEGYIDWVASSPNHFIVLSGDIYENNIAGSKSDIWQKRRPREAVKYVVGLFSPVRNRIIGAVAGNHERRSSKIADTNPLAETMERLEKGRVYRDGELKLKIVVNGINYYMYVTHGTGSGGLIGGRVNKLQRLQAMAPDFDVFIAGHIHQAISFTDARCDRDGRLHKRIFCSTGTTLAHPIYAKTANLPPSWTGFPRIRLDGERKDAHVSI